MGSQYRKLLGYLPQDFGYYGDFTAERFLQYMATLKALPEEYARCRIEELLELVDLKEVKKKKLKSFSGGMLRRIGIAKALINDTEILILDEPTAELDPKERVRFRNIISSLGKNRIVLLSTHIVSDIEYIADCILIMKNGELIRQGTEKDITENVKGSVWKCIVPENMVQDLDNRFIVSNLRNGGEYVELRIISDIQPIAGSEAVEWHHTFQKVGVILTPIIYSLNSVLKTIKMVLPAIDEMLRELIINRSVDCSPGALRPHISLAKEPLSSPRRGRREIWQVSHLEYSRTLERTGSSLCAVPKLARVSPFDPELRSFTPLTILEHI